MKYTDFSKTILDVPGMRSGTTDSKIEFIYLGEWRLRSEETIRSGETKPTRRSIFYNGLDTFLYDGNYIKVQSGKKRLEESESYGRLILDIPLTDSDRADFDNRWFYPNALRVAESRYRVLPKLEKIDGAWCHVVECPGHDKLWIDPELRYSWRRRERSNVVDGKTVLEARFHSSDFQNVSGMLVPMDCTIEAFPPAKAPPEFWNRVSAVRTIKVGQIQVNDVSERDFDVSVPAGTVVMSENGSYRVSGDRSTLLAGLAAEAQPFVPQSSKRMWIVLINVIAMIAVGLYLSYTRFRAARAKKS